VVMKVATIESTRESKLSKHLLIMASAMGEETRPKRYECRFMKEGLTNYPDESGITKTYLINRKVMDEMQKSFVGCPVVREEDHEGSSSADNFKQVAVGVVSDVWTDEAGWDWAQFIVWDARTQQRIDQDGWNVSCAYGTVDYIPGGDYNAIHYDHEIKAAEYLHLAIVPAPRQTGAQIFLNSLDVRDIDKKCADAIMFAMNGINYKLYPKGRIHLNSDDKRNSTVADANRRAEAEKEEGKKIDEIMAGVKRDFDLTDEEVDVIKQKLGIKKNVFSPPEDKITEEERKKIAEKKEAKRKADEEAAKKNEGGSNMTPEEKKAAEEKAAKEAEAKKNEGEAIDPEKAMIETPEGDVPLKDLITTYQAEQAEIKKKAELESKESEAGDKKILSMEDEYEGVKVKDMYDCYKKSNESKKNSDEAAKKTEEEAEAKKNEAAKKNEDRKAELKNEGKTDEEIEETMKNEAEAEVKKNSEETEKKKEEDEAKKSEAESNKQFNALNSAYETPMSDEIVAAPLTKTERAKLAKDSRQY